MSISDHVAKLTCSKQWSDALSLVVRQNKFEFEGNHNSDLPSIRM